MTDIIQWSATLTGIAAAILVALNLGARITGWGFVIFTVSSVGWVAFAVMEQETPLAIQNAVLFCINVIGVWRYLFLKARKDDGDDIDPAREHNDHSGVGAMGNGRAAG